jgi:hypothetical protein
MANRRTEIHAADASELSHLEILSKRCNMKKTIVLLSIDQYRIFSLVERVAICSKVSQAGTDFQKRENGFEVARLSEFVSTIQPRVWRHWLNGTFWWKKKQWLRRLQPLISYFPLRPSYYRTFETMVEGKSRIHESWISIILETICPLISGWGWAAKASREIFSKVRNFFGRWGGAFDPSRPPVEVIIWDWIESEWEFLISIETKLFFPFTFVFILKTKTLTNNLNTKESKLFSLLYHIITPLI